MSRELIIEETEKIDKVVFVVNNKSKVLNQALAIHQFKWDEIPLNKKQLNEWIFKIYLETDETAKSIHAVTDLSLDKVKLPESLIRLSELIEEFFNRDRIAELKHLKIKGSKCIIDMEGLESDIDKRYRKYAESNEEVERLKMSKTYISWLDRLRLGHYEIAKYLNPMVFYYGGKFYPKVSFVLNSK